jgi:hypothetical protein
MLWVVAPLLHRLPVAEDEVNTVELPAQNVLLPEMVGVVGKLVTVTAITLEVAEVHVPEITATE